MPKDDRYYTFLLTRSSKSHLSIRRIEVSKRKLQYFSYALLLGMGLSTAAIFHYTNPFWLPRVDAKSMAQKEQRNEVAPREPEIVKNVPEKDFTDRLVRPGDGKGGPDSLKVNVPSDDKETAILERLAMIEKDPAWVTYGPSVWPR